jgi:tRNA(Ile)-lysidine synthase
MSKLTTSILTLLKQFPDWPITIAYSGGVDSQVLLHAIAVLRDKQQISNTIIACHVNHGLSANAEKWVEFAQAQCKDLNVPLVVTSVNLAIDSSDSLEALARIARYNALANLNTQPCLILTGHHSDDQAETFLLALKRGAGVKGLSAMKALSTLAQHTLVRPLLDIPRTEIVKYAHSHHLTWVEDESNSDTRFDRNFIRQRVLPELSERWPSITQTINRSAVHCLQSQELLDELAMLDLKTCSVAGQNTCLSVDSLKGLTIARFNNVMRYFLELNHCLMPTTKQLTEIKQQLLSPQDQTPEITLVDKVIRRYAGKLYLTPEFNDVSGYKATVQLTDVLNQKSTEQCSPHTITLPDGLGRLLFLKGKASNQELPILHDEKVIDKHCIGLSEESVELMVCFNHNNPKVLPEYRQHHRPLKKVLQELKISPWDRRRTPLIFSNNELVLIAGQTICKAFLPQEDQIIIHVYWLKAE